MLSFFIYLVIVITTGTKKHLVHREQLPPDLAGKVSHFLATYLHPESLRDVISEMP